MIEIGDHQCDVMRCDLKDLLIDLFIVRHNITRCENVGFDIFSLALKIILSDLRLE